MIYLNATVILIRIISRETNSVGYKTEFLPILTSCNTSLLFGYQVRRVPTHVQFGMSRILLRQKRSTPE